MANSPELQKQSDDQPHSAQRDVVSLDSHHELYEHENEEKERQYQQHKEMLEERRKAMHGNKYGLLSMPTRITPFCCEKCNKGFNKRKQYEKHLKTHIPQSQCRFCSFKTRNKKQFESHEMRHMKGNPQFECDLCQAKYTTSALLRGHRGRIHSIFHCFHCSTAYTSFDDRNKHMTEAHGAKPSKRKIGMYTNDGDHEDEPDNIEVENIDTEHTCDICEKPCRSRTQLRIHLAQHLNVHPSLLADDMEPLDKNMADISAENTEYSEDDKVAYTPPRSYKKRKIDISANQAPVKRPLTSPNSVIHNRYLNDPEVNLLARLKPASENATFNCGYCKTDYPNPPSLFIHVVTTHGFLEYDARRASHQFSGPCESKSNIFSTTPNPVYVLPGTDAEPDPNLIVVAPVTNKVKGTRDAPHLAAPPYRYICNVCGAALRKYRQLKKHLKIHVALKHCPECPFASKQTMRVIAHQAANHKKLFRCPYLCLKLFKTREELILHKKQLHAAKLKTNPKMEYQHPQNTD